MKAVRSARRWQRIKRDRKSRSETVKRNKQTELIDWNISFLWYYWPQAGLFWAAEHWGEMRLPWWPEPAQTCARLYHASEPAAQSWCSFPGRACVSMRSLRRWSCPVSWHVATFCLCCSLCPAEGRQCCLVLHFAENTDPFPTILWPCSSTLLLSSRTFSALFFVLIILTRLSSDF